MKVSDIITEIVRFIGNFSFSVLSLKHQVKNIYYTMFGLHVLITDIH